MSTDRFERVVCQPGIRGLYESHYLKAHGGGRRAFWIKYCVLSPRDPREPVVMEFWAVVWPEGAPPVVLKQVVALDAVRLGTDALSIDGAGMHLDPTRASGALADGSHSVRWSLAFEDLAPALMHLPWAAMYTAPLPKKKVLTPSPRARFTGELVVDGEVWPIDGWLGLRGHNWGKEHARTYAYGNCNDWTDGVARELDGFTVKIPLGPFESPWLSVMVGRDERASLDFRALRHWRSRAEVRFPRWDVWFRDGQRSLSLAWRARPEDMVGLRYLHPDGKVSFCYNTRFAHLDATLTEGPTTRRFASDRAELEFLFPAPIEGIALHGNAAFTHPGAP